MSSSSCLFKTCLFKDIFKSCYFKTEAPTYIFFFSVSLAAHLGSKLAQQFRYELSFATASYFYELLVKEIFVVNSDTEDFGLIFISKAARLDKKT